MQPAPHSAPFIGLTFVVEIQAAGCRGSREAVQFQGSSSGPPREALGPQTVDRLTHAIAGALYQVYMIADVLGALALALVVLLPAGASPTGPEKSADLAEVRGGRN